MIEPRDIAEAIIDECVQRGLTLATCESLTGGLLGATLTEIPGASTVYRGGFITYASELKISLTGVDRELVERDGVVNQVTAETMAESVRLQTGAELAVSVTGVAGPSPQDGRPPGTVWIGLAGAGWQGETTVFSNQHHFEGDRHEVRAATVRTALGMVLKYVVSLPPAPPSSKVGQLLTGRLRRRTT